DRFFGRPAALFVRRLFATCIVAVSFSTAIAEEQDSQAVIDEWKTTLSDLNKLRYRYSLADDDRKPEIEKQFNALMEKARQLEPKVGAAIEKQYVKDPKSHADLESILAARASALLAADDNDEVMRLVKMLIDTGSRNRTAFRDAVAAAVNSGKNEQALAWIEEAKKRGATSGSQDWYDEFAKRANQRIAGAKDESKRLPQVKLETSKGDIIVELCEDEAPNTVANFISLVEDGFYDGLAFHRIIPGFMAQGGDPKGTGSGGPGYKIACECYRPNHRKHYRGTLSMAHAGKDTGGSQFFLNFAPTAHLDGKHTVFGYVVDGYKTLGELEKLGSQQGTPSETPVINKATVLNKRDREYKPEKVAKE
ncbi:MAG: peptidylprolyl isomerase, partial [Pirellulales bacterium]|nr:peptidylprolyl isomerase [Pirellulales bacterium]